MRISLRTLFVIVTFVALILASGIYLRDRLYTRHRDAEAYFEELGADVIIGDPCPSDFVYYFDAYRRGAGLPETYNTPNAMERAIGFRFTWKPIRELSFLTYTFRQNNDFDYRMFERIANLAPEVECLYLPRSIKSGEYVEPERTDDLLVPICQLRNLRVLQISGWNISDADIAKLAKVERLQVLSLQDPKMTDEALETLKKADSLRFLGLQNTTVSKSAVIKLRNERPDMLLNVNGEWYGDCNQLYTCRKAAERISELGPQH